MLLDESESDAEQHHDGNHGGSPPVAQGEGNGRQAQQQEIERVPGTADQFREQALESINQYSRQKPVNPQVWESFASGIHYLQADFHDVKGYERLGTLLNTIDQQRGT